MEFENSRKFMEFMEKLEADNRDILRTMDRMERRRSMKLNIKLNTAVYRWPSWYWKDYGRKEEERGGIK